MNYHGELLKISSEVKTTYISNNNATCSEGMHRE